MDDSHPVRLSTEYTPDLTPHTALARLHHPPAPSTPTPMTPAEIPPGVQVITLPGGFRTLAYTEPAHSAPATGAPVPQPIPAWAKSTALLAPTVGGGIALAGIGVGAAAPALWAAAALMVACALALRAARRPTQINQHITARGLFSRATGHTHT